MASSMKLLECPPDEDDSKFGMQLEINQLQMKVRLLAGGTDGEQLAQVLLDREDELRLKDTAIAALNEQLDIFDSDRSEYEAMIQALDSKLTMSSKKCEEMQKAEEKIKAEVGTLKLQCSTQEAQFKTMQEKMDAVDSLRNELANQLEKLAMSSRSDHASLSGKIQTLEQSLKSSKESEAALKDTASHFEKRKQDIVLRSRALKKELLEQLAKEKEGHAEASKQAEVLASDVSRLTILCNQWEGKLKELEGMVGVKDKLLSELEVRSTVQEEKLSQNQARIELLAGAKIDLERLLHDQKAECEEMKLVQTRSQEDSKHLKQELELKSEAMNALNKELMTVRSQLEETQDGLVVAKEENKNLRDADQRRIQEHEIELLDLKSTICELKQQYSSLDSETKLKLKKSDLQNKELRAKVIRQDHAWKNVVGSSDKVRKSGVSRATNFGAGRKVLEDIRNIEDQGREWL